MAKRHPNKADSAVAAQVLVVDAPVRRERQELTAKVQEVQRDQVVQVQVAAVLQELEDLQVVVDQGQASHPERADLQAVAVVEVVGAEEDSVERTTAPRSSRMENCISLREMVKPMF